MSIHCYRDRTGRWCARVEHDELGRYWVRLLDDADNEQRMLLGQIADTLNPYVGHLDRLSEAPRGRS